MRMNRPFALRKTNPIQTQFKPNLRNAKMNVGSVKTRDYKNDNDFRLYENKPKTNPKQTQFH